MKKTDIDGALADQVATDAPLLNINADTIFGLHRKPDGQLGMGNKVVRIDVNGNTWSANVDNTETSRSWSVYFQ